ncbi:hypothetical protein [Sphingomonas sp. S2-65]|uniref:hypothetical protein n=1 Tax=Sphingomonas sp. S2-65 TaxID=2903960 RepID=UPI001F390080|nr:hypothetical protein [Sphingomonas sp. S2-65]UYY57696.1 hypothetical protein LZ586_13650 [Sphingomonas sp. S2-65]
MTNFVKKAVLGSVLGATVLAAAAPAAEAQRYRGYYRDRDNGGAALVAGIAGLAIGAALASDRGYDRRYDYDRRYYRSHGYYPVDGYYYRDNYRRYRGWERCGVRRMYDPYIGRPVRVRYCR